MKEFDSAWAQIETIILETVRRMFPSKKELLEYLPGMIQLAKQVRLARDRASRELGLNYLREAERDIMSCKVLHSRKLYAQATYHIQQAVEKATKGYLLGLGLYRASELKRLFTHQTPQLFLDAVLERTGIKAWAETLSNNALKTDITKAEAEIGEEDKRLAIARMSYADINKHFLSQIEVYRSIGGQMCTHLIAEVKKAFRNELPPPPPLFEATTSLTTIFILAIVTFPHEAYTRYPGGRMAPSDYTGNVGAVRAIKEITKYLEPEIETLRSILS